MNCAMRRRLHPLCLLSLLACSEAKPSEAAKVLAPLPTPPGTPTPAPAPAPVVPAVPSWTERVSENEGLLCISAHRAEYAVLVHRAEREGPIEFKPGSTLHVTIDGYPCLSSSCDRKSKHTCRIEVEGDNLVVHNEYRYEHGSGMPCTEDCQRVTAHCQLPSLKKGTARLRWGARQITVDVPGTAAPRCLDAPPGR
jgi:hypothetical protein